MNLNLEQYRTMFAAAILIIVLLLITPLVGMFVSFIERGEGFSELWILGSNQMAENYPFEAHVGEENSLTVGVRNHLGYLAYYLIYVKLRNQTQPPPDVFGPKPSTLSPIYEFRIFLASGETWQAPLTFIFNASLNEEDALISSISVNGESFMVDCPSIWDSERSGFYYELFFELWLYNRGFEYYGRYVGIWLKVTE